MAAVLAAAVVAVTAGCGLPASGRPVVDGEGPALGERGISDSITPPGPDSVSTQDGLVRNYLLAAAGRMDAAPARIKPFLTAAADKAWSPTVTANQVEVVRAVVEPPSVLSNGTWRVRAELTTIGTLNAAGVLEPVAVPVATRTEEFTVVPVGDDHYRLAAVPRGMLLDAGALETYYVPHEVYFWSQGDNPVLVPDLRYVPRSGKIEQTLVEDLLAGPSRWLAPAVSEVPKAIELDGRVVRNSDRNGDHVQVNLSAKAAAGRGLDRFMAQLRWTLLPEFTGTVDLQIGGSAANVDGSSDSYRAAVPFSFHRLVDPLRFGVVAGRVRLLAPPRDAMPDILDSPVNSQVQLAAVSWDRQHAALVRAGARNGVALWTGQSGADGSAHYIQTDVRAAVMSRPVWVDGPGGPGVYVVADGALRYLPAAGAGSVDVTPAGIGPLNAVAVAPDGRRVALIAQGRLYVAPLVVSNGVPVPAGRPRLVDTSLSPVLAVGWSGEGRLLVAGGPGRNALRDVTVDGAVDEPLKQLGNAVAQLVTYANDPVLGADQSGWIMVQYHDPARSYIIWNGSSPTELLPDTPEATPSPGAGGPDAAVAVLAPFFLDY